MSKITESLDKLLSISYDPLKGVLMQIIEELKINSEVINTIQNMSGKILNENSPANKTTMFDTISQMTVKHFIK